jgi:glyoxylase-like metal-dependent hydrolase (beta-lactamase superfamily II)
MRTTENSERTTGNAALGWEVYVTPGIATASNDDLPPGQLRRMWSPLSSTLIYGQRDAVLVDTFITIDQADALVDWVRTSGKNLTTIYITHGHADHFFGVGTLLEKFPNARAVATPGTVSGMKKQLSVPVLKGFWSARFPGLIPEKLALAEELDGGVIELEGQELKAVEVGHTDTDDTTCLHVPSIGLVVGGDTVYNGVHQLLSGSDAKKRREWIAAVDKVESLRPRTVVAGHKRPGNPDSPRILEETRQYIRDFDRIAESAATAHELYNQMLELYPIRMNVTTLWASARAVKG